MKSGVRASVPAGKGEDGSTTRRGGTCRGLIWQEVGEELHGGDEVAPRGQHHEVDGVEVFFASETAAQVGAGIDGGQGLAAARADEAEASFTVFAGPVQMVGDDPLQRNLVPQTIQQVPREVLGHGVAFQEPSRFRG